MGSADSKTELKVKKVVWRWKLTNLGNGTRKTVSMPLGTQIISSTPSPDGISLYGLSNPNSPKENRTFVMVQTGTEVEYFPDKERLNHVTSLGPFHLFEVVSECPVLVLQPKGTNQW